MNDPLDWIDDALNDLQRQGLRRRQRRVRPLSDGRCEINGRTVWNFAGNDYLNLAGEPRVLDAARQALLAGGAGARASALVCGRTEWHERLEARLAAFEDAEAALLFPTGYAANVGTVCGLVGRGDVVLGDRLNHASLTDGCRLSGARFRVYPHGDVGRLDHELGKQSDARRKLIVTDGVFSMDGDLAPLAELAEVAVRHRAMLLVDEAHATGVLGERGRGACEAAGMERRAMRVGTLSKAVGAQGGFAAGPRNLIDWLWNTARTQMYSTALTPAACAAASAALDLVESEPFRRTDLAARCALFRDRLRERGIEAVPNSRGPIVPIVMGRAEAVMQAAHRLEERGFLVGAIRPPSVPRDTARLRISITWAHSENVLRDLADAVQTALGLVDR